MASARVDDDFPHALTIDIPFPTHRLAKTALRSLAVDEELSALVKRQFSLVSGGPADAATSSHIDEMHIVEPTSKLSITDEKKTTLRVYYEATTPRMLRVAVNGFFESLAVIVQVMEELDVDVLHDKGIEVLEGVQGVEQDTTGTAVGVRG